MIRFIKNAFLVRYISTDSLSTHFKPIKIPGLANIEPAKIKKAVIYKQPRCSKMQPDSEWVNIWPTKASFNYSVVPLPVRQGFVKNLQENQGIVPSKFANMELIKIPNFLHLTPKHIKEHCAKLKKLCNKWPSELDERAIKQYYPVVFKQTDYFMSSDQLHDPRSKIVSMNINLDSLKLAHTAKLKLLRLCIGPGAGKQFCKYDWKTNLLTIFTDRCPTRKQNYEYLKYVLTVLTLESIKVEDWEKSERTANDLLEFDWSQSSQKIKLEKVFPKSDKNKEKLVEQYRIALEAIYSENSVEKRDLWFERPEPVREKKRHRKCGGLKEPPFEILHGASEKSFLEGYKNATTELICC